MAAIFAPAPRDARNRGSLIRGSNQVIHVYVMTAGDILNQLDACAADFSFPMLDNAYVYLADVRLSIYRNTADWLMIVEVLGINNPRTHGFYSFNNLLHVFGNALNRPPGTANSDFLYPMSDCTGDPLFAAQYDWFVKEEARCVMVRDRRVELDLSEPALSKKGIRLLKPPRKDPVAVLRSLLPEYRSELLASDGELAARNPKHLPLWLRLDEWHHPDLGGDEKPSESETFAMLADAITSGNKRAYRPSKPPNTHWSHWRPGGTL